MIYIYAQFYWYLVLSILYVVLLFYNIIQAARRGRQVPRSLSLQPIFGTNWASLLKDKKKNKKKKKKKKKKKIKKKNKTKLKDNYLLRHRIHPSCHRNKLSRKNLGY